jgi:hypothetical protein
MKSVMANLQGKPFVLMAIIAGVSLIAIGWNIFTVMWINDELADFVRQGEEAIELEQALVSLHQQELAGQRYLLTGALDNLIQHKQFETLTDLHLNQADRFLSSEEDLALLTEIRHNRDAYEAIYAHMLELYQNGAIEEAIHLSMEEAEANVKQAREQLESFVNQAQQAQKVNVGTIDRLAWVSLVISLIAVVVFVGITSIAFFINQQVLKFLLLFAASISLLVIGWNLYNIWQLKSEINGIVIQLNELNQIEQTEILFLEQEMAELDYLLSGDEAHLNFHQELEKPIDDHWKRVVSLQTTSAEAELINALKQDHDSYEQTFKAIVSAVQQGNQAEAIWLSIEEAGPSLDDVQRRVDEFVARYELQLEKRVGRVDRLTVVALSTGIFTLIILMMETIISTTVTVGVQIQQLRIEIDEAKRQQQVSEIVDSDFFQDLQAKAKSMRSRRAEDTPPAEKE